MPRIEAMINIVGTLKLIKPWLAIYSRILSPEPKKAPHTENVTTPWWSIDGLPDSMHAIAWGHGGWACRRKSMLERRN